LTPKISPSLGAKVRAITSLEPPGGKPTTMLMVPFGKVVVCAVAIPMVVEIEHKHKIKDFKLLLEVKRDVWKKFMLSLFIVIVFMSA
jgi:hypothetical protein